LSQPVRVQLIAALAFVGVLVVAAVLIADSWADWVVFGAVFFTFLGFAVAVNRRQYHTGKRGFTRDSERAW
jgi:fatty acid desaturase